MPNLKDELQELFREMFADDELELSPEDSAQTIEGWDSLMHINILIAVEETFSVKFATAEIAALKEDAQNIGKFIDLIERKQRGDE